MLRRLLLLRCSAFRVRAGVEENDVIFTFEKSDSTGLGARPPG
jgi:hypothetical protein